MRKRGNRRTTIARPHLPLEPLDVDAWYSAKYLAQRWDVHEVTVWVGSNWHPVEARQNRPEHVPMARLRGY
jgi:hypothetical protein